MTRLNPEFLVVTDEYTALASRHEFRAFHGEASLVSPRSDAATAPGRAVREGTVLDQSKVVTFAEVEKGIEIGSGTSDVHGNGRPGLRRDRQRRPCPGCSRPTGIVKGKCPFAPARNEDETRWRVWREGIPCCYICPSSRS